MFIEIHQFDFSVAALTDIDLAELLDILGIHEAEYSRKKHYKTNSLLSLEYGFGKAKRSVYVMLGNYNAQYVMEQDTRILQERDANTPNSYLKYRPYVSVELHGSFFDNSPDFSMNRLLLFLFRTGFKPKALDVAYCDNLHVTKLSDWLRVFRKPSDYCLGNITKKGLIYLVEPDGIFHQANIGNASSKSAYGTLYQRPEGMRLEIKYREPEFIRLKLLSCYDEKDLKGFNAAALDALITNLDILTAKSKQNRDPTKYVRANFFQKFLDSEPSKVSLKELKETLLANRDLSRETKITNKAKKIAGIWDNLVKEFSLTSTLDELRSSIDQHTSQMKMFPVLLP